MIEEVGLNFSIRVHGAELDEKIRQSTESNMTMAHKLSKLLPENRAHIVITHNYVGLGQTFWGYGNFDKGLVILGLPKDRQSSYSFIKNVAKHEATHLLGLQHHHINESICGYDNSNQCNFEPSCPSMKTCECCLDAITYFWKGVEKRTGTRFVKY